MEENKGITLIALVVSIVILIILASVSMILVFSDRGIIHRAKIAIERHKEASAREELVLTLGSAQIEKIKNEEYNQDEFLNKFIIDEIPRAKIKGDIVTLDGYEFEIDRSVPKIGRYEVPEVEPTYICVAIKDGVLSYYSSAEKAKKSNPDKIYEKVDQMKFFVNWNNTQNNIPWKDEKIERVVIEDEIAPISTEYYFCGLKDVKKIEKLENLKTNNATSMLKMFFNCTSLEEIDLSGFNTKNVENMDSMFANCSSLNSIDVSKLNTSKVTNMNCMFQSCTKLTELDLSSMDTSSVVEMAYMFQTSNKIQSLDLSGFDTSNVKRMDSMFNGCSGLTTIQLSDKFVTNNVENMLNMFRECSSLKSLDLSHFNTLKVTNTKEMFARCTGLQNLNISNFDMSNVTTKDNMFGGVANNTNIVTNAKMKEWLKTNYSNLTNVHE